MRAWELLDETRSPPSKPITLRGLHKIKLQAKAKEEHDKERFALFPLMYGNPDIRRERLELERMELEMEQLRAEILATNAETANKSAIVLHKNAQSGIKAEKRNQQKLTKLAKNSLGRSLKA